MFRFSDKRDEYRRERALRRQPAVSNLQLAASAPVVPTDELRARFYQSPDYRLKDLPEVPRLKWYINVFRDFVRGSEYHHIEADEVHFEPEGVLHLGVYTDGENRMRKDQLYVEVGSTVIITRVDVSAEVERRRASRSSN